MNSFLTIIWDFPKGLDFGFYTLRIYSLLFALAFIIGYQLMKKIFLKEKISLDKLESLVIYMVVATIIGARLGHVFFYQWDYYSLHPMEILKVWEGGLASHGAAIAIVVAAFLYSKKVFKDVKRTLWILDRLVIVVALAACLIRFGNWFNSEIYGDMGNSKYETVFVEPLRDRFLDFYKADVESIDFINTGKTVETDSLTLPVLKMYVTFSAADIEANKMKLVNLITNNMRLNLDSRSKQDKNIIIPENSYLIWDPQKPNRAHIEVLGIPRHPTQIFEALAYLLIFIVLFSLFNKSSFGSKRGFLFGAFLVLLFGFRFFIEFLKENQVDAEAAYTYNIGQYLSIPMVLIGLFFMIRSKTAKDEK